MASMCYIFYAAVHQQALQLQHERNLGSAVGSAASNPLQYSQQCMRRTQLENFRLNSPMRCMLCDATLQHCSSVCEQVITADITAHTDAVDANIWYTVSENQPPASVHPVQLHGTIIKLPARACTGRLCTCF